MNTKNADQVSDATRAAAEGGAPSSQSLGQQLRSAREARGVSLREVSDQTRISMRYLEAIEADDFKRLPGGIFNRSFTKAYARQIGFSETAAMEAFARATNEQGDRPDELLPYRPRVYGNNNNDARPKWLTALLTLLILAILSLGVYAALHWYQRRNADPAQEQGAPATDTTTARQEPNQSAQPAPATDTLSVRVRAVNQSVWLQTQADDARTEEIILNPGDAKEFAPRERLRLKYAKNLADSLEVTINGRAVKVPTESRNTTAEMLITKDYEQPVQ